MELKASLVLFLDYSVYYYLLIYLFIFLGFQSHKSTSCKVTGKKEEPQLCVDCGKMFSCRETLKRHIETVHCRNDKSNICVDCGKMLSCRETLKRHFQTAHRRNDKSNICDHCGKGFAKSFLLKNHIKNSHSRKTCEHCGKSVLTGFFFKKHLVFDHGIKDGAFICDICPKRVFFVEDIYKKHIQDKHINSKL